MHRMTRSGIKSEPSGEDYIAPTFSKTFSNMNGTSSRSMSVRSRATPAQETTPMHENNTASSGDTTVADDVDMDGTMQTDGRSKPIQ